MSEPTVTNLAAKISALDGLWQPQHVATMNGSHSLKVARVHGTFIWHAHPHTDELFYCVSGGPLRLELANADSNDETRGPVITHTLHPGDVLKVPRGRRHRPVADEEAGILMLELVGTVNTGDAEGTDKAAGRTVHVDETKNA